MSQKPGSVGQYFEGPRWNGAVREVHASTCNHCGHITEFPNKRAMFDHVDICRGCMSLICLSCIGHPCRPQEMECERIELEGRIRARVEPRGY